MAGCELREMMFWVPQTGSVGVGVSIMSYNGRVHFGLIPDARLIPDPDSVIRRFGGEFEKLLDIGPTRGDGELRFGRIETIPYTTAHGFSLEGKLLYPTDYVEGKRYPLIVDAYPMNSGNGWMHPMGGNQAWATAGYLVFKPHQARAPHVTPNCAGDKDYCAAGKGR